MLFLLKYYFRVELFKNLLSCSVFEICTLNTYCSMNLVNFLGEKKSIGISFSGKSLS